MQSEQLKHMKFIKDISNKLKCQMFKIALKINKPAGFHVEQAYETCVLGETDLAFYLANEYVSK